MVITRLDILNLVCGYRPVIAVEHHQIGQLAGLNRPQVVLLEHFVGFDEELPIRRHVDRFFKEKGIEVNLEVFSDNIEMVKEAVAHGVGVGILPFRSMRDDIQRKRLTAIRLAEASLYRPLGIIYRKKKPLAPPAQAFLELLRESAVQE